LLLELALACEVAAILHGEINGVKYLEYPSIVLSGQKGTFQR
jgi:hypothetical protein